MGNSEYSASDLVAMSADYFAANPDVDHLVAVVGTGTFYRPERHRVAEDEATVVSSTTLRILRSELPVTATPSANAEVPEFPAVVGTLELLLGKVKLEGALPGQLAELIYQAASQEANPAAMLEAVVDFLMDALAAGLDSITYAPQPAPILLAAKPEPAPSLADVVAGGKLFVFAPCAPNLAAEGKDLRALFDALPKPPTDAPAAKPAKVKAAPAAKPAKVKAAPKNKASTKVNAA